MNKRAGFIPLETTGQHLRIKRSLTGFTLIELLISIGLVGMIILAIAAIDLASRRFLNTTNYEAQVQSEASPVVGRIAKDITLAYGTADNPGIQTGSTWINIGQVDNYPHTYTDLSDDPWIRYEYSDAQDKITRQTKTGPPPGSWGLASDIARNIEACAFIQEADGTVRIGITARRIVDGSPVTFENPRVILETSVFPRSSSLN